MRKPVVGERLYSLNIGNAARNCEQVLTSVTVKKVGRKYFYCLDDRYTGDHMMDKYHLDTWHEETEHTPSYKLYENAQDWQDEKETRRICKNISKAFEYGKNKAGLPLSSLRLIEKQIIENGVSV